MLKVVFFGSSKHVIPIIEALRKNFNLSFVFTTERLASQGEALRSYPVVRYCIENKIPYFAVSSLADPNFKLKIENLKFSIGVLASFGAILPNEVLNFFPHGIINIHPSLLPKYRGPTPVQTAILNGDTTAGVTIIKLDEEVDHGPILTQKKELIQENDTSESLYERLFKLGASSIVSTIELYLKGKINPQKQDHSKATFTKRLTRQDGHIDLQNPPAKEIFDRMIRAYYPWPSVWTRLTGPDPVRGKILKFLPEKKIQVEGKKPMSHKDFINGYPEFKEIIQPLFAVEK